MRYLNLTERDIRRGMRSGRGLKRKQATLLGLKWPLVSGWMDAVIGMAISEMSYDVFVSLKAKRIKAPHDPACTPKGHQNRPKPEKTVRIKPEMTPLRKIIMDGCSGGGGWNAKQLSAIGVSWPPRSGWIERLHENPPTLSQIETFLSLKGQTKKLRKQMAGNSKKYTP